MSYIEKRYHIEPSEETLQIMKECGYEDFSKFVDSCISVACWMISAKKQGMGVGCFVHETKQITKFYHPMLEAVSAKGEVK